MDLLNTIISGNSELWAAWFTGLIVFGFVTVRLARRIRFRRPSDMIADETGAAYSMSFVFTIPLYLLFCGMMLEITFLVIGKIGTVYGAYAGARSSAAWDALQDPQLAADRLHQAVCSGIAPFAASVGFDPSASDSSRTGLSPAMLQSGEDYATAMLKSANQQHLNRAELVDHYFRICHRVTTDRQFRSRNEKHDVVLTVTYRAPLVFPGVARWFDVDHRRPYDYELKSTIHMIRSLPKSRSRTLGIDYHAF